MTTLNIEKHGSIHGGSCTYSYDPDAQLLYYNGGITIKWGFIQKTKSFSGKQSVPVNDMLSANAVQGETFILDGYTFTCLNTTENVSGTFSVSGSGCNGTFDVDLSGVYMVIIALHLDVSYDGISGTIIAH